MEMGSETWVYPSWVWNVCYHHEGQAINWCQPCNRQLSWLTSAEVLNLELLLPLCIRAPRQMKWIWPRCRWVLGTWSVFLIGTILLLRILLKSVNKLWNVSKWKCARNAGRTVSCNDQLLVSQEASEISTNCYLMRKVSCQKYHFLTANSSSSMHLHVMSWLQAVIC